MQNELVTYKACPLCDTANMKPLRSADCTFHARWSEPLSRSITWMICPACRHVFRSGYYTDEALGVVFRGTNANQVVGYELERQRPISARMIEKVLPYQSAGIWLDVGFGNGSLLFTAAEYGFDPVGLDLRQDTVDQMKKFGIPAYCKDIAQVKSDTALSVVSMADVLEHIPYPKTALRAAYDLLSENGVLLISMPNMDSPAWVARDRNNANPFWGEVEHYHNFGRRRLYALLDEMGFVPVRYGISERYILCMEVVAIKKGGV